MVTQVKQETAARRKSSPSAEKGVFSRSQSSPEPGFRPPARHFGSLPGIFLGIFVFTMAISVASVRLLDASVVHQSLFDLVNFTGPATRSLLSGNGLSFCYATGFGDAPLCFHAARMPMASWTVAAGMLLFGDSFVRVSLFKIVLLLLPLEFAVLLVCRRMPASRLRRTACVLLLVVPFGMTIFIANVVNLQVEEDYAYSLIACAFGIVLFGPLGFPKAGGGGSKPGGGGADTDYFALFAGVVFVLAADGLYLSKSSLSLAAGVLAAAFLVQQRGLGARLAVLGLVLAAPVGWAMYVHHASGRYDIGTSLDGFNLHKGNGPIFMAHYPPPPLSSLDDYDDELNRGLSFGNEWSLNDYHMRAGVEYIRTHPRETLIGEWRKFKLLYLSLTKYGSSDSHGLKLLVEKEGLVLFRSIFWATVSASVLALFSRRLRGLRGAATAYLALVAACALPYLIGFGYTRHASILIYPASLMGCRLLCAEGTRK